jgi:hypothetical protein
MIVRQSGARWRAEAPRPAAMHGETSERGFFVFIDHPGRVGAEGIRTMLDRFTHRERHPRAAGTAPSARREQCAPAPWGDVRPAVGTNATIGRASKDSGREQRGMAGMRGAVA